MFDTRISQLQTMMQEQEIECISLTPGASFYYFTGMKFHLMERPVIAFIKPDSPLTLLLPDLERMKAEEKLPEAVLFSYDETSAGRSKSLQDAFAALKLENSRIGIEPLRCRAFELWMLQSAASGNRFEDISNLLGSIRSLKSADEIDHMKQAAVIAEQALQAVLGQIQPGLTEKEIAAELIIQLLRAGSEPELPFEPIVASGPNSALPHATPTSRRLQQGDLLLFDWGARAGGYISDITRTFAVGDVDPRLHRIYDVVLEANTHGREAARPGITGAGLDHTTTQVLINAGHADLVRHRTGHGIGLEAHEPPYLSADQNQPLQTSMAFTIEPGLYIPGLGGVRIEDDMILEQKSAHSLTSMAREWKQL